MLRRRSRNNSPATSPAPAVRGLTEQSLSSLNPALPSHPPSLSTSSSPSSSDETPSPTPLSTPAELSRMGTTDQLLDPSLSESSPHTYSTSSSSFSSSSSSSSSVRSILWQLFTMGWPSATTCLIQNLIQLSSTLFLGHVSATALGAATIGNMTCNLTGFSVGMGFTTCLDALCSQAYGGRQYHLVGLHAQKGLVMLTLACLPVALIWSQTRLIVTLLGVDEETAGLAQSWANYLTFGMPAIFFFECIRKWLQAQRIVWPVVVASLATIVWNLAGNSIAIYHLKLGFKGPAMVMAASFWVMFSVLAMCAWGRQRWVMHQLRQLEEEAGERSQRSRDKVASDKLASAADSHETEEQVTGDGSADASEDSSISVEGVPRWSDALHKPVYAKLEQLSATSADTSMPLSEEVDAVHDCWPPLSMDIFTDWSEHFRLGLPGAASLFLEWGSYEVSASLAATLGPVPLAAHSIYMSTVSLWYMVPLGFSNATAAIIGNQLGAGEAKLASTTARIATLLCLLWGISIGGIFTFALRSVWGELFIEDPQVRGVVERGFAILWVYAVFDSVKCCLMAVLRGCGRPGVTVWGNILSCWLTGYPMAYILIFKLDLGLVGLWSSMTAAWLTATATYTAVLLATDWDDECRKATHRNVRGCIDAVGVTREGGKGTPGELEMDDLHGDETEEGVQLFQPGDMQTEEGMRGEGVGGGGSDEEDSGDLSGVEETEVVTRRSSHRAERELLVGAVTLA